MGLDSMRVIGRGSAGVKLFDVANDEHVVSAALIGDSDDEAADGEDAAPAAEPTTDGAVE
jgi:DNA gyrase subunit A